MAIGRLKLKSDGIMFVGNNAEDVTGSMTLIKFANKQILLEAGLYQNNDYLESYKVNTEKFKFKPEEIDYVFVGHCHIDHIGLLPRLVKEGFTGKIIMTYPTSIISKHLLLNCVFILADEARVLSKRYGRDYSPIYSEDDVYNTFKFYTVYNQYDTLFQLDDVVSFQWLKNSHCVGAAQLQLILNDGIKKRKLLYTSDIGALETKNHYVENTEVPTFYNDLIIMESTYGLNTRISKKTREFDVEHLRVAIDTVLERHGTLVLQVNISFLSGLLHSHNSSIIFSETINFACFFVELPILNLVPGYKIHLQQAYNATIKDFASFRLATIQIKFEIPIKYIDIN